MTPTVIRAHSAETWVETAAEFCASTISEAVNRTGRCAILLAGGDTPRAVYERLAQEPFASNVPWAQTVVVFGDERLVPPDDARSNQQMAHRALLNALPLPPEHILAVDTRQPAAAAAASYESMLRTFFHLAEGQLPVFDLVLLGMGTDGHTASLFPEMAAIDETTRLIVATPAPDPAGPARITVTLPVINAGHTVLFLVRGADKAPVARRVLRSADPADTALPAARVQPTAPDGRLVWIVDEAAAAEL